MDIRINWGEILGKLVTEVVKGLVPMTTNLLLGLVDKVYQMVEDWANGLGQREKEMETAPPLKPTSAEKMTRAVSVMRVMVPEIDEPTARCLLEAKHMEATTRAFEGGRKPT